MAKRASMLVLDKNGLQGTVISEEPLSSDLESHILVRFQNGQEVFVSSEMLFRHKDGLYQLPLSIAELMALQEAPSSAGAIDTAAAGQALVIPVIEESVKVQTHVRETGTVEIRKAVQERTETVDQLLHAEEVEIERVAINRIVEEPLPIRHEGDTTIIPLLAEVLVIEKRLVLREEVHIRKLRKEVHDPQEVLLREERVEIVRKPGSGQDLRQDDIQQ
jgi:stress response protein YsnF